MAPLRDILRRQTAIRASPQQVRQTVQRYLSLTLSISGSVLLMAVLFQPTPNRKGGEDGHDRIEPYDCPTTSAADSSAVSSSSRSRIPPSHVIGNASLIVCAVCALLMAALSLYRMLKVHDCSFFPTAGDDDNDGYYAIDAHDDYDDNNEGENGSPLGPLPPHRCDHNTYDERLPLCAEPISRTTSQRSGVGGGGGGGYGAVGPTSGYSALQAKSVESEVNTPAESPLRPVGRGGGAGGAPVFGVSNGSHQCVGEGGGDYAAVLSAESSPTRCAPPFALDPNARHYKAAAGPSPLTQDEEVEEEATNNDNNGGAKGHPISTFDAMIGTTPSLFTPSPLPTLFSPTPQTPAEQYREALIFEYGNPQSMTTMMVVGSGCGAGRGGVGGYHQNGGGYNGRSTRGGGLLGGGGGGVMIVSSHNSTTVVSSSSDGSPTLNDGGGSSTSSPDSPLKKGRATTVAAAAGRTFSYGRKIPTVHATDASPSSPSGGGVGDDRTPPDTPLSAINTNAALLPPHYDLNVLRQLQHERHHNHQRLTQQQHQHHQGRHSHHHGHHKHNHHHHSHSHGYDHSQCSDGSISPRATSLYARVRAFFCSGDRDAAAVDISSRSRSGWSRFIVPTTIVLLAICLGIAIFSLWVYAMDVHRRNKYCAHYYNAYQQGGNGGSGKKPKESSLGKLRREHEKVHRSQWERLFIAMVSIGFGVYCYTRNKLAGDRRREAWGVAAV